MQRRLFLQFPLLASALIANAKNAPNERTQKGFKVEAQQNR
jgi:hypothetical protein